MGFSCSFFGMPGRWRHFILHLKQLKCRDKKKKSNSKSLRKRLFSYFWQHFHLSYGSFLQFLLPQNCGTGKGFLLTSFGCRAANEVICWSPFIIHIYIYTHPHMHICRVCVYIFMHIYTYLYALSVHTKYKKVLAHFTSHKTFKLIKSLLQDAQHDLIHCSLPSLSPKRSQRLKAMFRKRLDKMLKVTVEAESQFQKWKPMKFMLL